MKLLSIAAIVCFLLFFVTTAFRGPVQQTDFSGTWVINKGKIQFGEAPEWVLPKGFTVSQQKDSMSIIRIMLDDQMGEHPFTETLTYDGKESHNTTFQQVKKTSTLLWIADGKSFVLTTTGITSDGKPGNASKEIWSLDDEGQTLIVDRSVKQADGMEYTIKAYYDKKK
jgi:hypothetical protein